MATDLSIALADLLDKTGADSDFLREAIQLLAQALMELEVSRKIGAGRHRSGLLSLDTYNLIGAIFS